MVMTSPHGGGIIVALVLASLGLWWAVFRPTHRRIARVGVVIASFPILVAVALFGSGSTGSSLQQFNLVGLYGLPPLRQDQVREIVADLTSSRYMAYVQQMKHAQGRPHRCAPDALGDLSHELASYAEAKKLGFHMSPPPPPDIQVLVTRHVKEFNAGLVWLRLRDPRRCSNYVQTVFARHFDVHRAMRQIDHSDPRIVKAALSLLGSESLTAPEWVLERLPDSLEDPELNADLAAIRRVLKAAVSEPERRGMSAGTRIDPESSPQ